MAITFGTVTSGGTAGVSSFTCAKPSGVVSGTLLVAVQGVEWDPYTTMTTPTGGTTWNLLAAASSDAGGSSGGHVKTWWKIAGAAEPTTYTFAGGTGSDNNVIILPIFGADPTTPVFVAGTARNTTNTAPSVTPTTPADLLICATASWFDAVATTSYTAPAGMVEQADTGLQYQAMSLATEILASAAATGTNAFTRTSNQSLRAAVAPLSLSITVAPYVFVDPDNGPGQYLLEDGTGSILLEDGTSHLLLDTLMVQVAANVVAGSVAIPLPTVIATSVVSPTPAAISRVVSIPTPTVIDPHPATITASVISSAVSIPAPIVTTAVIPPYLTSIHSSGRYFLDQYGNPFQVKADSPWSIIQDASSTQMDLWVSTRQSQGFNMALVSLLGNTSNGGPNDNGATYDGVLPFVGGDMTQLNSTYWSRVDYLINACATAGITLQIYPIDGWTGMASYNGLAQTWTQAQAQSYGTALAARLSGYSNIVYCVGGDYPTNATVAEDNRQWGVIQGLISGGASRMHSIQFSMNETSMSSASFWDTKVDWDFVYAYDTAYTVVELGYGDTLAGGAHLPALTSEILYDTSTNAVAAGGNTYTRGAVGWSLTSGSPGEFYGHDLAWQNAPTTGNLNSTGLNQTIQMRQIFGSLSKWHLLIPDFASTFITAGRGTKSPGSGGLYTGGNTYVTGAKTADGTLALIYIPNAVASTITIAQAQMVAGYTATWRDPTNGASVAATPAATYNKGNTNSAGGNDWFLVLQASTTTTVSPTVISGSTSFPASTKSAGTGAALTASVISRLVSIPAPTVSAPQNFTVTSSVISSLVSIPAPTSSAGTGASVTASVISRLVSVPAPTVSAPQGFTVTSGAISSLVSIPAPTMLVGTGAATSVATISRLVSIPVPTMLAGISVTISAAAISRVASIGTPTTTVISSATVAPATITGVVSIGTSTPAIHNPLVITVGGTYAGGNRRSTDSNTPAISVQTTSPVVLTGVNIIHAGVAIDCPVTDTDITVTNCTFTATAPTVTNSEQQALRAWEPAVLVFEHNATTNSHGIQVSADNDPAPHITTTFRVQYNNIVNVGRLSQPSTYQGAVHVDNIQAPDGVIKWNRVTNSRGLSHCEDTIALSDFTAGTSGHEIEVAYNLVNGSYPISGDGSSFTGGAFDFADIGGQFLIGHHNYAINYTNNGFMIPTGNDVFLHDNVAVYDGIADDSVTCSTPYGWGFTCANLYTGLVSPNTYLQNNRSNHRRWNGTGWETANFQWNTANAGSQDLGGNSIIAGTASSTMEQTYLDEFEALVTSNSITIGLLTPNATITPSTVSRTVSFGTPTVTAASPATITSTTISRIVSIPTPATKADAKVTATVISRLVFIPAPTSLAGTQASVSASTVNGSVTFGSAVTSAQAISKPAGISGFVSIPLPSVLASNAVYVTPATISRAVSIPAVNVVAPGTATSTPSTIGGGVSIPTPVSRAAVTIFALAASTIVAVGIPTIVIGTGTTANPSTVSGAVSIGGQTATAVRNVAIPATTISRVVVIPTVTTTAVLQAAPTTISRTVIVGTPTITASRAAVIHPATLAGIVSINTPGVVSSTSFFTGWGIPIR